MEDALRDPDAALGTVPTSVPDGTIPDNSVAKVPSVTVDVLVGTSTAPTTRTVTVDAVEDTQVSQNAPTTDYGGATTLQSDARDVSDDSTSRITSYPKFRAPQLAAGESITAATLSLHVHQRHAGRADGPPDGRRVGAGHPDLEQHRPARAATVGDFGVLPHRPARDPCRRPAGHRRLSFELHADSTDGLDFISSEGTAKPRLTLTISSGG